MPVLRLFVSNTAPCPTWGVVSAVKVPEWKTNDRPRAGCSPRRFVSAPKCNVRDDTCLRLALDPISCGPWLDPHNLAYFLALGQRKLFKKFSIYRLTKCQSELRQDVQVIHPQLVNESPEAGPRLVHSRKPFLFAGLARHRHGWGLRRADLYTPRDNFRAA